MVARNRHVVEEDLRFRAAADRVALAGQVERLAGATPARADHERGALMGHRVEVHRTKLAGLVHLVDLGRVAARALGLVAEERSALLAVVSTHGVGEAALRAVHRYSISASAGMPLPARMSVSCCTSAPLITDSPSSCFFRSRLTSSARRMSILPWRIRRLYEISCSSSVSCWMRSFSSLSESAPRSGNVSKAVLSRKSPGGDYSGPQPQVEPLRIARIPSCR